MKLDTKDTLGNKVTCKLRVNDKINRFLEIHLYSDAVNIIHNYFSRIFEDINKLLSTSLGEKNLAIQVC